MKIPRFCTVFLIFVVISTARPQNDNYSPWVVNRRYQNPSLLAREISGWGSGREREVRLGGGGFASTSQYRGNQRSLSSLYLRSESESSVESPPPPKTEPESKPPPTTQSETKSTPTSESKPSSNRQPWLYSLLAKPISAIQTPIRAIQTATPEDIERINDGVSTILRGVRYLNLGQILRGSFKFTKNENVRSVANNVIHTIFGPNSLGWSRRNVSGRI